jgi:hypothetical protein
MGCWTHVNYFHSDVPPTLIVLLSALHVECFQLQLLFDYNHLESCPHGNHTLLENHSNPTWTLGFSAIRNKEPGGGSLTHSRPLPYPHRLLHLQFLESVLKEYPLWQSNSQ